MRAEKRVSLIKDLLKERISKQEAAGELRTTIRTVERYVSRFLRGVWGRCLAFWHFYYLILSKVSQRNHPSAFCDICPNLLTHERIIKTFLGGNS